MPEEYPLPSHQLLRPHHDPEWSQAGYYLWLMDEDGEQAGTKLPCIVHQVDIPKDCSTPGHSADGRYWNVSITIVWPGNSPHPGKVLRKAGIFWKEGDHAGFVTSGSCGPPYPG